MRGHSGGPVGDQAHRPTGDVRVGFVLETILGHGTHAANLQRLIPLVPGIRPEFHALDFEVEGLAARVPVFRSNWSVRGGLRARRALRRMQHEEPLDAVFVHTQVPAVLSMDRLRRQPSVVSIDATPAQLDDLGLHYQHRVQRHSVEALKRRVNAASLASATRLVAWSDWARQGLERDYGVSAGKTAVIAPGVEVDRWARGERPDGLDGPVRILFVGGDLARKGGDTLLDAVRHLAIRPDLPDIHVDLVTNVGTVESPSATVHLGLTPNDPRLIELYGQADIFCLPTHGDCLPMVLAEAGAASLPLVSTPVGAIPEIVRPGESGELVPAGDTAALSAALERLVSNPIYRRRLGEGAHRIVRAEHDAATNARRVVDVVLDAVATSTTSRHRSGQARTP